MADKFENVGDVFVVTQSWAWGRDISEVAREMFNKVKKGSVVMASFNGVSIVMRNDE